MLLLFQQATNVFVKEAGYSCAGSNFWKIANKHQRSRKHVTNHTTYRLLGNVDVGCALDEARRREIEIHNNKASRYGKMLLHHIDVAVFLSAQGLAFRGHDESKLSSNRGNFIELLQLLSGYSNELSTFLDEDRTTYTSHEPQNELIECIYKEVRAEIQGRIDNSRFLAVMMDDTSDISNVEQSAVSVRLVHNGNVEEHLLGMVDVSEDASADGLTKILAETLKSYNITPENAKEKLIGQSYDGAPTMSGELRGVQKQMQQMFPFAYYNHCVAHRMALCASQSANKVPKVSEFFGILDKLVSFFRASPKRTTYLGRNLPKPGDTRWFSRDTAVTVVDTWYETIGTALFEIANDSSQKTENQATARGLCKQIQQVEFVYLLKLYRKLFEHCTPIITVMQKPSFDALQLASMLEDFQRVLCTFDLNEIWEDALAMDPTLPVVRSREGWRGVQEGLDGSATSWKLSLETVSKTVMQKFSEQLQWRFENVKNFKWMSLVHPAKFEDRKKGLLCDKKVLISELLKLYPFAVHDQTALENNLSVMYHNEEISILLRKLVRERDALAAKKKEKRRKLARIQDSLEEPAEERADPEELDTFEPQEEDIEVDLLKEGQPSLQDLLEVIKKAELEEALPEASTLVELAVTTPLTSVHCERVFSRMKRIVSPARSTMSQKRKEMLVFLQVEHKTLRWLAKQQSFKDSVVNRFKSYNRRRHERFSRK